MKRHAQLRYLKDELKTKIAAYRAEATTRDKGESFDTKGNFTSAGVYRQAALELETLLTRIGR